MYISYCTLILRVRSFIIVIFECIYCMQKKKKIGNVRVRLDTNKQLQTDRWKQWQTISNICIVVVIVHNRTTDEARIQFMCVRISYLCMYLHSHSRWWNTVNSTQFVTNQLFSLNFTISAYLKKINIWKWFCFLSPIRFDLYFFTWCTSSSLQLKHFVTQLMTCRTKSIVMLITDSSQTILLSQCSAMQIAHQFLV